MKITVSIYLKLILLIAGQKTNAQTIESVYSKQVQYSIIKASPAQYDKRKTAMVKTGFSKIRYALNQYFGGSNSWLKNEIKVEQSNSKFYINKSDSLMTTVYAIKFNKAIKDTITNEYIKIQFPPGIIPEEDYLLWKNQNELIIVAVYFNMAYDENSEDYTNKQNKLRWVQNWLKENKTNKN